MCHGLIDAMRNHQNDFRAAILSPDTAVPDGLCDGKGRPAGKRFNIYRNNVTMALITALRTAFPAVRKLVGPQRFEDLALFYARSHPPRSPLMMHYGVEMPACIKGLAALQHIPYLSDIAQLELALRRSYHAADVPVFEVARLGELPPEALMASELVLAPAVFLVTSPWPLVDIWRYNMQNGAPKPCAIGQSALVTRAEFDPEPHAITADQAEWLQCVINKATLGAAQDAACAKNPDFDLAPLLGLLIQTNAIVGLKTPKD